MKKILSVVLAGAMILGMSVSAFAENTKVDSTYDKEWGNDKTVCLDPLYDVNQLAFADTMYVVSTDGRTPYAVNSNEKVELKVGDELYFYITEKDGDLYNGEIDQHWSVKIKGNQYVADAEFVVDGANHNAVKVTIVDKLDNLKAQDVKFDICIFDTATTKQHNAQIARHESAHAKLTMSFDNYKEQYVEFDAVNDVDYTAKWIVRDDEKGTACFNVEDECFVNVKMIPEEKVIFDFTSAYDKDIDKKYNEYDAELAFYNFQGTKDEFTKVAELFIPADDDTYIYEVVKGELVEADAEYVEGYKADGVNKEDGWVIKTRELGYYVVADDELVVAEEEDDATEEKPSTDKQNPAMGANDFVGAAVALAVVSVAAAGALALKK